MIFVDFVVHCDAIDCKAVEHVPVEQPVDGGVAHVAVQLPKAWRQGKAGVYCEKHGPAEAA